MQSVFFNKKITCFFTSSFLNGRDDMIRTSDSYVFKANVQARSTKKRAYFYVNSFLNGRDDTIRTSDSYVFKANVQARSTKKRAYFYVNSFLNGRDDTIRTCDPFVPSEVRYQAALHPVIRFYSIFKFYR